MHLTERCRDSRRNDVEDGDSDGDDDDDDNNDDDDDDDGDVDEATTNGWRLIMTDRKVRVSPQLDSNERFPSNPNLKLSINFFLCFYRFD